ncbi:stage V sporulation protein T [Diplocloster agilis]|uniref:Stage V sporulation protein T n=1 Tax=Diplocloster agilis TaxID=2850323 RepID=A0A949JYB3_9FIRM|nr:MULTISPECIES: stage V sporulation protein T [Lachnospiraceae]MBU9737453.1 stage V sporulation protein T [Diplocloster agilis]MBU9745552.1 stage V sporulation protein T [Diplocloster agilis]MCU6735147.1 stage V sporulation protein T [Suonthocola fibrivorans]SCJ65248.1 Stage V sporulation protein T [uncultured Clostridium sp.]
MKATGIVRRIDELGRVVIPKEIRRTLRIREGDPLEIFTDREGEIILKKYSPIGELSLFAKQYAESLAHTTGHTVCITDRDMIIAVAGGSKKGFMEQPISKQLESMIDERETLLASKDNRKCIKILAEDSEEYTAQVVSPIICEGDAIGAVILFSRDAKVKMGEVEQKVAMSAAGFLGRQMEQ